MKVLEKAAVLLLTLGEEVAGEVMKHLKNQEIQKVTSSMMGIDNLKHEDVDVVTKDYLEVVDAHPVVGLDGGQYMQRILSKSLGDEKATEVMENFLLRGSEEGLEGFRMMEPRMIGDIVRREHPQVIAFIMASLDPVKAGQVLEFLPDEMQSEVVYRISTMEDISPSVLGELEEAMKSHVSDNQMIGLNLGGIKYTAELLNRVESSAEKRILEEIRNVEEPVSQQIEEQLFTFEDIQHLEDRTLQAIIKEVDTDLLAIGLRGTDDVLKNKFFANMSERASGILQEQMELMGPVRLRDVEKAQQEVVTILKALEAEGKVVLGGKGGDDEFV